MVSTSKSVIVAVTKNGVAFDTPSELTIKDEGEIPTCSLTFPAGMNSRYKVLKKDILRVSIGLDAAPDFPQFTGHLDFDSSKFSTALDLQGSLNRGINDNIIVNDYSNFDGQNIEDAIRAVFEQISELAWMTPLIEQTNPSVKVPNDIRFKNGIKKYDLMKQFREMAIDPLTSSIRGYTMFQHGDQFHFRKIPDPSVAPPSISLSYGDGLLNFEFDNNEDSGFNYARVKGKDGVISSYQNDHRIAVDGLKEMEIISDDTIPNAGESYEVARVNVLSSLFSKSALTINSHLLLDAIPNYTVVEITGAPYGLSDTYLVRSKNITIGEGMLNVQCRVTTPTDVLSDMVTQLLSLNRSDSMK